MAIQFHQTSKEFHLYNEQISYIIKVLENGQLGHVYFGKHLTDREDFGYLVEYATRDMAPYPFEGRSNFFPGTSETGISNLWLRRYKISGF